MRGLQMAEPNLQKKNVQKKPVPKKLVYEGAAGRYRTLMMKSNDPARRRMLEEMIARELEAVKRRSFTVVPMTRKRLGEAGTL
jgi:hypothetical protein